MATLDIKVSFRLTLWFRIMKVVAFLRIGNLFMFLLDKPMIKIYINDKLSSTISYNESQKV